MVQAVAKTKKERVAEEVAKAVGAGRLVAVETVDFSDPNRPKTCLEVDFPILPINQIATIEGKGSGALKPIYQVMKWWARRRSTVFRQLLIAAAMKAPAEDNQAAKAAWDVYYANHQKKGALKHLKVADIFMGGGTTIVEGSRLGMQMFGIDLNPVAWFVVKNEMARVDPDHVQALLDDIERDVKPQIMPFYACDCPRGHKGNWTQVSTGEVMGEDFDPLALKPNERSDYKYEGPEIIYVFWAKHGPCQVTGCGHRTPIMSSPVVTVKTLTVKAWEDYECLGCGVEFDVEAGEARMAPGVPLAVAATEKGYAVRDSNGGFTCPHCERHERFPRLPGKDKNKKIELTLLVHPAWLAGAPKRDAEGREYGGSATDTPEATARWNQERARTMRLLEVRGTLPEKVTCPETGATFSTDRQGGTVPKKSSFSCEAPTCGKVQDILTAIKASGRAGQVAAYAIRGFCPSCAREGQLSKGKFFAPIKDPSSFDSAHREWATRRDADLAAFWPRSTVPFGFMTGIANGDIREGHGFTHWWTMFNPRQLLVHAQILRAIVENEKFDWSTREYVLGVFQQYLRNQNMFCFWNVQRALEPMFSNNNYHPKPGIVENSVFRGFGRGDFKSCAEKSIESLNWANCPWEIASPNGAGHSEKILIRDSLDTNYRVECGSATELSGLANELTDLVITDPPFGGLLHYSELADFFYVWLRLVLRGRYPEHFNPEYTPKALEAVANRARQPDDPDEFYQRVLTQCWKEAYRILKPGGLLAFTFHHSEDEPWYAVLESLFAAEFYLEATYPIRSDETKGEGEFGSKKIEYDIIHVCRKRTEEPQRVSWGRMRREVLEDVRQLQTILEHHAKQGLPAADLQVIKRGKALEYFSRHYGQVYVDDERALTIKEALLGINQLLDEGSARAQDQPPANAEPMTRQLLRLFQKRGEIKRDELGKFLRGTGLAPSDFIERGWCREEQKIFYLVPALEIAQDWHGRHKRRLEGRDYDQAMILIGACHDASGINAADTIKNENFKPHPALGALLDWNAKHGATQTIRNAAARALHIYQDWERRNPDQVKQMSFFDSQ